MVVRIIRKLFQEYKSSKARGNHLPELTFDLNPLTTLRLIKTDFKLNWCLHYTFLFSVILFVLYILPIPLWFKFLALPSFVLLLLIPLTSQFLLNGLPVLTWVFLFFSSSKVPVAWRPPITVKFLPAMETILYGDNLSQLLASYTNTFLDVLAWIPYGMIHFSFPFVIAALIWLFAPPKTLRAFGMAFGYMNLIGVIIQNLFPAAPPWYKILHGLDKANYSMHGSPGGLGRIDKLLGVDMYTTTFTNSPLIFGAFPSLHSGCATMDALWLWYLFPKGAPAWFLYVCWLWWSTMYLTHHYFIDLILGSTLSITAFYLVKMSGMTPNCEQDKFCRWSYDVLKSFDYWNEDPLNFNNFNDDDDDMDQFIIDNDEDDDNEEDFDAALANEFANSNRNDDQSLQLGTGESYELQDTSSSRVSLDQFIRPSSDRRL